MKRIALVGLVLTGILASCGSSSTPIANTSSSWTQEEVNAAKDLSELGEMSFQNNKIYLGDKSVDPAFTKGKFYGKDTIGHVIGGEVETQGAGYSISSSTTNLYSDVSTCATALGRLTLKNNAITQPNRTSYYLAVDSSIYFNTTLKAKDFKSVGGTPGARTSGVSLEVMTTDATCFAPRPAPEGRGYHKGIEFSGEGSIIKNTSDKFY